MTQAKKTFYQCMHQNMNETQEQRTITKLSERSDRKNSRYTVYKSSKSVIQVGNNIQAGPVLCFTPTIHTFSKTATLTLSNLQACPTDPSCPWQGCFPDNSGLSSLECSDYSAVAAPDQPPQQLLPPMHPKHSSDRLPTPLCLWRQNQKSIQQLPQQLLRLSHWADVQPLFLVPVTAVVSGSRRQCLAQEP